MRRVVSGVGILVLGWLLALTVAAPVMGFSLSTCTLTVVSRDATGAQLDTASGPGAGGTREDPLEIDPAGSVEWVGTTGGSPIRDSSYHVEIYGVPTPLRGSSPEGGSARSDSSGSIAVGDVLFFDVVGIVFVSGAVEVDGQTYCEGSGWIQLPGDPVGTPAFFAGAGLILLGVAKVLTTARRRDPIGGVVGGLLGGAGAGILSGVMGIIPFDENTPLTVVIASVIVGLAVGVIDFSDLFSGTKPPEKVAPAAPKAPEPAPVEPTPEAPPAVTPVVPIAPAAPPPPLEPPPPPPIEPAPPPPPPPSVAPAPAQGPAMVELREGLTELPETVRPEVERIVDDAESQLERGPVELDIGPDVITRIVRGIGGSAVTKVTLGDGVVRVAAKVLGIPATITATPTLVDGNVAVRLTGLPPGVSRIAQARVDNLIDTIRRALAERGQRIGGIGIGPDGIFVQTEVIPGGG